MKHLGVRVLKVRSDSKLIVKQVVGRFEANDPRMKAYFDRAYTLSQQFQSFSIEQVSNELNQRVDGLAKGVALGEYDRRSEIILVTEQDVLNRGRVCNINNEPPS